MKTFKILKIKTFCLSLLMAASSQAFSLQQSMEVAFERNPRTQANDIRLKAMQERTHAAWLAFLPTLSVGYNLGQSQYSTGVAGVTTSTQSYSRSMTYALSVNIYDGGAKYYSAQSAEAAAKAQEAQTNSTNALIPNTKGAIAGLVFEAYSSLLKTREESIFYTELRAALVKILSSAVKVEDQNRVSGSIAMLDAELSNLEAEKASAARDFEYVVKLPVPPQIDDYHQTIASIIIPPNPEAAIDVALQKSPELKVAAYQLESMQLGYTADRRATLSPRVDAGISKTNSLSSSAVDPTNSTRSTTVGVTVTWTLSAQRLSLNKAAALEVEAAQKERDGAYEELKYKIDSTYPKLENYAHMADLFEKNLEVSRTNLENLLARIDHGEHVDITAALGLIQDYQQNWSSTLMMKQSVLTTKFMVQKTIGTLFEQVKLLRGGNQP